MIIVFRSLLQICGILVLVFAQVGFFSTFDPARPFINLTLFFLLYLTLVTNMRTGLTWALIAGVCLDLLSVYALGTITLSFMLTIMLIALLFRGYISNVSLYSLLLLISLGTVLYWIFLYILSWIFFFLQMHTLGFDVSSFAISSLFLQVIGHNILSIVLFYVLRGLKKSFFWIHNFR